jgi:hypothetical protein
MKDTRGVGVICVKVFMGIWEPFLDSLSIIMCWTAVPAEGFGGRVLYYVTSSCLRVVYL